MQTHLVKYCAISSLVSVTVAVTIIANLDLFQAPKSNLEIQQNCTVKETRTNEIASFVDYSQASKPDVVNPNKAHDLQSQALFDSQEIGCSKDCFSAFLQKISLGQTLDATSLQQASDNAFGIARLLQNDSVLLNEVETVLSETKDAAHKDTLVYILSKLPQETLLMSAQRLTLSTLSSDRLLGLSLLEASIGKNRNVGQELATVIHNENEQHVLLRAIDVVKALPPESVDTSTQDALSNFVNTSTNEKLVNAALMAKISISASDEEVRTDVAQILQQESENLKLLGLQGLGKVLERQQYDPNRGNWHLHAELKQSVVSIANNVNASPSLRIEALNVLNRHFSD